MKSDFICMLWWTFEVGINKTAMASKRRPDALVFNVRCVRLRTSSLQQIFLLYVESYVSRPYSIMTCLCFQAIAIYNNRENYISIYIYSLITFFVARFNTAFLICLCGNLSKKWCQVQRHIETLLEAARDPIRNTYNRAASVSLSACGLGHIKDRGDSSRSIQQEFATCVCVSVLVCMCLHTRWHVW